MRGGCFGVGLGGGDDLGVGFGEGFGVGEEKWGGREVGLMGEETL